MCGQLLFWLARDSRDDGRRAVFVTPIVFENDGGVFRDVGGYINL